MKLFIRTQVEENYSDDLVNRPYWKFKPGSDYFYKLPDAVINMESLESIVAQLASKIEHDSIKFKEYIAIWSVESDDYLTWFEQSQLDYEGKIQYPSQEVTL